MEDQDTFYIEKDGLACDVPIHMAKAICERLLPFRHGSQSPLEGLNNLIETVNAKNKEADEFRTKYYALLAGK